MFGVSKNGFIGDALIYFLASVANATIPLLLLPILTRYLTPSEYGTVAVFQVWTSLIGAICGLGAHGAIVRKYYDYDDDQKNQIGSFIFSCIVMLGATTLVALGFIILFSSFISNIVGLSMEWLCIGVLVAFCNLLTQIRLGQWQVRKQPRCFGLFLISASLLNLITSIILVVICSLGVAGRLGGNSVAAIVFGLASVLMLKRDGFIKLSLQPKFMREALKFGLPLVPHMIGGFLLITVDRAVISAKLGLEQAGYYMVAVQISMAMSLILESINKAYSPWLYKILGNNSDTEKRQVVKITYLYALFLVICVSLCFMVADYLVVTIAGAGYERAGEIIGWLVLAKGFQGMYFMFSGYLFYAKRTGTLATITIVTGFANVGLLLFLTSTFGLLGAAWAACISMFMQWAATCAVAAKVVSMPWHSILRSKS